MKVRTQILTWKTHNVGKTTAVHKLQNTLRERNTTARIHRGNELLSSPSPHAAVTVEATTSHTHTLSLTLSFLHTRYTTTYNNMFNIIIIIVESMCPKSYLYIYDFRHIYICVLPNRSQSIGTGSWISRFSVSSIRRDMFPNRIKNVNM